MLKSRSSRSRSSNRSSNNNSSMHLPTLQGMRIKENKVVDTATATAKAIAKAAAAETAAAAAAAGAESKRKRGDRELKTRCKGIKGAVCSTVAKRNEKDDG